MAYLALVRHGESEWNALDLWTGWVDEPLTPKGIEQARVAGGKIKNIHWDMAFISSLNRSGETLDEVKKVLGYEIPTVTNTALDERNYGNYTGRNKLDIEKEIGEEAYLKMRRGWDVPIPNGETLKDVYARVIPYFKSNILPELKAGRNVIISAHGNSLRALVKYLDNIPDDEIQNVEIPTGEVKMYTF